MHSVMNKTADRLQCIVILIAFEGLCSLPVVVISRAK